MADGRGLPLLSGPPPTIEPTDSCRKCGKEFNVFLNRARKCNHCGYSYCHSCTDFQALMPRGGQDAGYDSMNVCAYCIDFLGITAAGRGKLKTIALGKLKKYADAYNIKIDRAVEKDDVIDGILAARNPNGCLTRENESFYRQYSVPNRVGTNRRGFFSRSNQNPSNPPPPPPQRPTQPPAHDFPRPDLEPDVPPRQQQYAPPPGPPPGQRRQRPQPYNTSSPPPPPPPPPPRHDHYYHHSPPPMPGHRPDFYSHPSSPRPPPPPRPPQFSPPPQMPYPPHPPYPPNPPHVPHTSRPASTHPHQRSSTPHNHHQSGPNQSPPRPRAPSAAPPPAAPPPSLDELLNMTSEAIGSLSISALKAILFINHVNAGMILEKSDLVTKVKVLAADERRERERQRAIEEQEEAERVERQRALLEQFRVQREREEGTHHDHNENAASEQRGENNVEPSGVDVHLDSSDTSTTPPPPPPKTRGTAADLERTGLCVICQDEEANIAIVDCGHLALCRGCSELIMASSRECPLCRTRIVTEARLLRIFKS